MEKLLGFLGKFGGKVVDFVVFTKGKAYEFRLKVRKVKTRRELGAIAKNSDKVISEAEVLAIEGLLKSHNLTAKDAMLPIKKVVVVDEAEVITPKLMDDLYKTGQKVFLVEGADEISGLATLADIVDLRADGKKVKKIVRFLPAEVSGVTSILKCLAKFAEDNSSVLLVVDDKGKQIGLLRLEDILQHLKLV
jgi:CBS domain containing-hemolysin-like protein